MNPEKIREILLADWDPLNVGDSPQLADEYDRYIPRIVALLNRVASVQEIEEFLMEVEISLGISPEPKRSRRAAIRLASK
jgi:hypothetical protein